MVLYSKEIKSILYVASVNEFVGDFSVYSNEYNPERLLSIKQTAERGDKVLESKAKELFPELFIKFRWRN